LIEVHIVTESNASNYAEEMASYHRWRHLIYVEERGWSDLRKPDGLERDQFDTAAAVHLLAMDDGEVVGGSRLMPASGPTILSEVFPHLCERGDLPRNAETLDWTRMFVVPSRRVPRRKRTVRGALFAAVMDYAVSCGARQVGGVIETFWLPHFESIGWRTHVLGLPQNIAGSMTLAAYVEVNDEALQQVRTATGWVESVLRYERRLLGRYGT
jgi:acyl-homoserine lactone synthase